MRCPKCGGKGKHKPHCDRGFSDMARSHGIVSEKEQIEALRIRVGIAESNAEGYLRKLEEIEPIHINLAHRVDEQIKEIAKLQAVVEAAKRKLNALTAGMLVDGNVPLWVSETVMDTLEALEEQNDE